MGHLLFVASKVAKENELSDGYRVVVNKSENNKHNYQGFPNLYIHVIGGQQLSWPPINSLPQKNAPEESKEAKSIAEVLSI